MKKIIFAVVALVCTLGLLMTGCSVVAYHIGAGNLQDNTYDFTDFNSVEVTNNFEYEITQSADYSVKVTTHENLVGYLDVTQVGQTVRIGFVTGSYSHTDAKVVITMPGLSKISVSGASSGSVKGFNSADPLNVKVSGASQMDINMESGAAEVNVSGASRITGNLKAQDTRFLISGASRCELDGVAKAAKMEVSGASQVEMSDLSLVDADVNISGASRVTVNTTGTLDLDISGASTLNYFGKPILSQVSVTGASHIYSK